VLVLFVFLILLRGSALCRLRRRTLDSVGARLDARFLPESSCPKPAVSSVARKRRLSRYNASLKEY